ncbi:MAG: TetR/AcrR family transcriptional regulator [Veillonella sp.]|nr:TetR/AcrR family transcriptional regulator [Veillonella sp.]
MDTKTKIKETAYRLFENHPFSAITTSRIIKESGVSRRTFYNHFPDKYELMYNYYEDLIVVRVFGNLGMPTKLTAETWAQYNTVFFELLKERQSFYSNVNENDENNDFQKFIYGYAVNFYKGLRQRHKQREQLTMVEQTVIHAFSAAFISVVKDLMDPKSQLTPAQATEVLKQIIPEGYRQY